MTSGQALAPLGAVAPVPKVTTRGGAAITSTIDVAADFGKRPDDVLKAVDKLIAQEPACRRNFAETSVEVAMPNGGTRLSRAIDMDRDGFALLAMGFSGARALRFKLAYIEAFNAMEATLRSLPTDPEQLLRDPAAMRQALLGYVERVIDAEAHVAELAPQAAALCRLTASDGSLCITDAAKTLQMKPRDLFAYMRSAGWIFRRPDSQHDVAYQARIASGELEHKLITVRQPNGRERAYDQVRVTTKGLTKLAKLLAAGGGA